MGCGNLLSRTTVWKPPFTDTWRKDRDSSNVGGGREGVLMLGCWCSAYLLSVFMSQAKRLRRRGWWILQWNVLQRWARKDKLSTVGLRFLVDFVFSSDASYHRPWQKITSHNADACDPSASSFQCQATLVIDMGQPQPQRRCSPLLLCTHPAHHLDDLVKWTQVIIWL